MGFVMAVETAKSHTVRVSARTHQELRELSRESREPITLILARAVERYRRQRVLDEATFQYDQILLHPAARAEFQAEVRELEGTLLDGLEDDPW